jgi:HSP20 family protein
MNLIYSTSIQALTQLSQLVQGSLASFLEDYQQSTLWIGNTEDMAIAAMSIQERTTEVILKIQLCDVDIPTLEIQLTQETVLLQGKLTDRSRIEGYFYPGQFQTLIPLPYPVHPETVRAELQQDMLLIHLPKQAEIQQHRVKVDVIFPDFWGSQQHNPASKIAAKNARFEK